MNTKLLNSVSILTLLALSLTNLSTDAALSDANYVGGNNGVTAINQTNGMQFDLNAGTTTLNWNKFNVKANETVNYNFNAANSTAFNQINSIGGASTIAGKINAIGIGAATSNIILNNAAGVSFVNGSVINVGAMTVQSEKPIMIQGLRVLNGNLDLKSTKGRIDVQGLIYDNAGNLSIDAAKQVAIGGIKNANKLTAQTPLGIYVKAEDYMVGGETVSGITTDYLELTSTSGGYISLENGSKIDVKNNFLAATKSGNFKATGSKITVGKDFLALTGGNFKEDGNRTIVTKNGTYKCDGYGGGSKSEIINSTVATKDGVFKIFANKLDVTDSTVDNLIVSSGNFVLKNSNILGKLEIGLDGTNGNDTPTSIINSYIKNMEMEYSTLSLTDTIIDNLGINKVTITASNSSVADNLYYITLRPKNGGSNKIGEETVTELLSLLKDETSTLHLGYTQTLGSNYSGDITIDGNMSNKNIKLATTGNIKMNNISNMNTLSIDNSKNTTITYAGDLKLNNILAQNKINITANDLVNPPLSTGTINSLTGEILLNLGVPTAHLYSGIDANSKIYSVMQVGSNIYNMYNNLPYIAPPVVIPPATSSNNIVATHELKNYVDTLNVDDTEYVLNPSAQLAKEFGSNIKSLAADMPSAQLPMLKASDEGFSIVKAFIPALSVQ